MIYYGTRLKIISNEFFKYYFIFLYFFTFVVDYILYLTFELFDYLILKRNE